MTAILVSDNVTESSDIFALISGKSTVKNADDDTVFEIEGVADGATFTSNTKDTTAEYNTAYNVLMKVSKTGNEIKSIVAATINKVSAVVSSGDFVKHSVYVYEDATADGHLSANLPQYVVDKKDGDRIQIDSAYQVIKDAKVYMPKLNSSNAFDTWTVGSIDDIGENDYVILLQTNKNSNNWDTVIVVSDSDAKDCPELISK